MPLPASGYSYLGYLHSKESTTATLRPSLTVVYQVAPNAATLTSPNGGEVWNASHSITWNPPLDIYNYGNTLVSGSKVGSSSALQVGQVFTTETGTTEKLKNVDFYVTGVEGVGSVPIQLYATSGGLPTGSPLASTSVNINTYGNYSANFNYSLAASTTYAIVFGNSAPTSTIVYIGTTNIQMPYEGNKVQRTGTGAYTQTLTDDLSIQLGVVKQIHQYHIQISSDNGTSWTDVVALTAPGATLFTYDFSAVTATAQAKVRVRTHTNGLYSGWDTSDAVFTIGSNQTPTAPTALTPGSTNSGTPQTAAAAPVLAWTFSDPNVGDTQSALQIVVYNGVSVVHDSGWVNSSASSYTVPNGTLSRNVVYNWKVRTKDYSGAISPYSSLYYVKTNRLPTPTLTSYTDSQTLTTNNLTFTWTYSDPEGQAQAQYRLTGSQDNWATIGYDSGTVNGAALTHSTPLLGSGTWKFKLVVNDGIEWSTAVYRNNLVLPNAFEPNETSGQAFPVNYNQNYTSLINSVSDQDYFAYTAAGTGVNRVTLQVPAGLNYDIQVYDDSLSLIAAGVRGTGSAENVLYDVTSGHTYYIRIVGVGGDYHASQTYTFHLSRLAQVYRTEYEYDANGNLETKTTVAE